jgi:hypothetical protein
MDHPAALTEVMLGWHVDVRGLLLLAKDREVANDVNGVNVPGDEAEPLVPALEPLHTEANRKDHPTPTTSGGYPHGEHTAET